MPQKTYLEKRQEKEQTSTSPCNHEDHLKGKGKQKDGRGKTGHPSTLVVTKAKIKKDDRHSPSQWVHLHLV